jgi:hypothetical protein
LDIINFVLGWKPNKHFVTRKHQLIILKVVDKALFFHVKYLEIICWIIAVDLLLNLEHNFRFSDFAADNFKKIGLNFFLSLKIISNILLDRSFSDLNVIFNRDCLRLVSAL